VPPYRRLASPAGAIAALRARIAEREAQVTPQFWQALSAAEQSALADLRLAGTDTDLDVATEAHSRLLAAIESALDRLPQIEAAWCSPDLAPLAHLTPAGRGLAQPRRTLALARKLDAAAQLAPDQPEDGGVVRLTQHGCPFSFQLLRVDSAIDFVELATSVSRATAAVEVVLGGALDDFKAAVGLLDDVEIGDAEFDALFRIRGVRAHARAILGPPVRSALRMLAGIGEPSLSTGEQRAVMAWRGMAPSSRQLERVAQALTWIRGAPPTLLLRA
jgi:hypothetical protein